MYRSVLHDQTTGNAATVIPALIAAFDEEEITVGVNVNSLNAQDYYLSLFSSDGEASNIVRKEDKGISLRTYDLFHEKDTNKQYQSISDIPDKMTSGTIYECENFSLCEAYINDKLKGKRHKNIEVTSGKGKIISKPRIRTTFCYEINFSTALHLGDFEILEDDIPPGHRYDNAVGLLLIPNHVLIYCFRIYVLVGPCA